MKVSEVIKKLQALKAEHGDLGVVVSDFGCGCCGGYDLPSPRHYVVEQGDDFAWNAIKYETAGTQLIRLN